MAAPAGVGALRPTERVADLAGELAGLHLVRYGGGDAFRAASTLLHLSSSASAENAGLRERVLAAARAALAERAGADDLASEHLPASEDAVDWAATTWTSALVVSTPVLGMDADAGGGREATRANLFCHGWLHAAAARAGRSAAQAWPLVGVWHAAGGLRQDPGDGDALGETPSACFAPGRLAPVDAHIHRVDPWAGGSREDMIALCLESGMSREDAEAVAAAEAAGADDYHLGADMARVQLPRLRLSAAAAPAAAAGGAGAPAVGSNAPGVGLVVFVDLTNAALPRALLTLLVVLPDGPQQAAARDVAAGVAAACGGAGEGGGSGIQAADALRALAASIPELGPLLQPGDGAAAAWLGVAPSPVEL